MTEKQHASLEDQLASVMEREGISVLAADGVRFVSEPTKVEVTRAKAGTGRRRRRSSKTGYAERPAISILNEERSRDAVADLDRVVVGFGQANAPRLRTAPVAIRHAEHERSPFVVSLRGLTFAGEARHADERVHRSNAFKRGELPVERVPDLTALTALASDLRVDENEHAAVYDQFTPATFEAAYALSYGPLSQFVNSAASVMDDLTRWFRKATALEEAPAAQAVARGRSRKVSAAARRIALAQSKLSFARVALGVGALLAVATLPANAVRLTRSLEFRKAAVAAAGADALEQIKLATNKPLPEGVEALRAASSRFREADEALSGTNALAVGLASLVPKTRASYRTGRALAEIGAKSADAAALLANGLSKALTDAGRTPLDRLGVLTAYAEGALPLLDDANTALAKVDANALPAGESAKITELTQRVETGRLAVREFTGLAELLTRLLGKNEARRYLIVFQNPSELRPTGGFMGSYAELKVDRGEIKSLIVPPGGTYDLQGQLTARVAPPEPLRLITNRWEFQDANWSPDFSAASGKIRFFWSKSGGPTVDGIIAVNATLVEKLLVLTGPIELPEFGKTITAENFMLETQKAVELEYDRSENKPKKILGALAPKLLDRLKSFKQDQLFALLGSLSDALTTKDIQVALSDPDEDALARRFGWSGQLKSTPGDSLAVVDANVAGQKTDLSVEERVDHQAEVKPNGSLVDTVTFTRTHTASKGELFRGVRNVTYVRFYVPRGSTLVSAEGFQSPDPKLFETPRDDVAPDPDLAEQAKTLTRHPSGLDVWDEGERTVFGGWSMVDPGNTQTLRVTYRLPFSVFDIRERLQAGPAEAESASEARAAYSLLLTSQSGKTSRRVTTQVKLPEGWTTRWQRSASTAPEAWDRDRAYAALYDVQNP